MTTCRPAAPGTWALPAFLQRWLTIKTEEGYYYPKYPFGISVLDAVAMRVGGVFQSRATAPP